MTRPLAIDLYCGLGGWTDGLLAAGWQVLGFDIERHIYGEERYPAQMVVQDVLTLHGSQFRDASLIVASPPCQEFSYMAMPWTRAKQIASALRGEGSFPEGYRGSQTPADVTALFDACFTLQRQACAAAGRHIPLVVENVKGAQPWVGRSDWRYGSYYLWGDVPALMPLPGRANKNDGGSWFAVGSPGQKVTEGQDFTRRAGEHVKQPGLVGSRSNGRGSLWFEAGAARHGSQSSARKAASARIARIPFALAHHIGQVYHPQSFTPHKE